MPLTALAVVVAASVGLLGIASAAGAADGRAYELVSAVDKSFTYLVVPNAGIVSADGNRVSLQSGFLQTDPEPESLYPPSNLYTAERDPVHGWKVVAQAPPADRIIGNLLGVDSLPDLSKVLWFSQTFPEYSRAEGRFFFRGLDRTWETASPLVKPVSGRLGEDYNYWYHGGSEDLNRFVFSRQTPAATRLLPDDPSPLVTSSAAWPLTYEVSGARGSNPSLRLVQRATNDPVTGAPGPAIGGACGSRIGGYTPSGSFSAQTSSRHAVSRDGRTIFFEARPGATTACTPAAAPARVFARVDGTTTTEVSASQCDRPASPTPCSTTTNVDDAFQAGSVSGQRVFFTTTRQLTNSDLDATRDLYVYDFAPPAGRPNLVQVTAGDGFAGSTNGSGASLLGVVRFADDGSRAYFVASGVLTSVPNEHGVSAATGQNNLYVWQRDSDHPDGRVAFVGRLDAADSALWAARDQRAAHAVPNSGTDGAGRSVGGDGRILVFTSSASLTPDAPGGTADAFRFDDSTSPGRLQLVSKRSAGSPGSASAPVDLLILENVTKSDATYANRGRSVSEDGGIVAFTTARSLVPEDVNDDEDVYRWKAGPNGGDVQLVTDGVDSGETKFTSMSESGDDIFFLTYRQLVPDDRDDATDMYTARVGGGFAATPIPDPPVICVGDDCQAPGTPPLPLMNIGSVSFGADGNVPLVPGPVRVSVGVSRLKPVSGSAASLKVRVPEAGRIILGGARVRRSGRTVRKAGAYRLRLVLRPGARKLLRKRARLRVSARVSYRAKDGRSASKTIKVTFKQPKAKRAKKTRKGGR